ncbi:leucine-rich repeat protein [Apibacter sp. HY039]|uniref:leucine-rich repeat protein n=1 Tax=Apibacter sp. HY039 TaxID=2501476 RepID=UPI000FEBF24E|nr:leucine-rich repeat protein [Apibacter sp. HY039]
MKQSYYLSLLCFFLCFSLSWGQLSKNYEVTTPGTLYQLVGTDKAKITDLSLTGTLNSADFLTIRQMTALKNLDMLNVYLVDGLLPKDALAYKTLNKVQLPKALKIIADNAFTYSTINDLDFTASTDLIQVNKFFVRNAKIAVIDLSKNLKLTDFHTDRWLQGAFSSYSGKVILPENLKIVKNSSFAGFSGEVELPVTVEVIEPGAFYGSTLKLLKLPKNLKKIEHVVFENAAIDQLDFSNCTELESIGKFLVKNAKVAVIDLSKNLKLTNFYTDYWLQGTFSDYSGKVILPSNLKIIPASSFVSFKGEVKLPENIEEIHTDAFQVATFSKIEIPSQVNLIQTRAFKNCTQLQKIVSHNSTPPALEGVIFEGIDKNSIQICVPKESVTLYKAAKQWSDFANYCEITDDSESLAQGLPNSYIYDVDAAKANNYGGLEIPVAKAYAVWKTNEYLEGKGVPEGKLSASVYWEDIEGLVRTASIDQNGKDSKIQVRINNAKGKGNAVIALHVGNTGDPLKDPVYWSWHVWVTDDPVKNAISYKNNAPDIDWTNTFMDRNLGATSNSFLGNGWSKSGGLIYQWGRKDPFPPTVYKDGNSAFISTLLYGVLHNFNYRNNVMILRPSDEINENITYAIQNPLKFIDIFGGNDINWFSKDLHNNGRRFDLWSDNTKGYQNSTAYETQLKSPFDPCPSGWRIPSYANARNGHPKYSPWGNSYNYVEGKSENDIVDKNNRYPSAKIYPGLGIYFGKGKDNYYLGEYPLTGNYVKNPDKKKPNNGEVHFQDNGSETYIWGASMDTNGSTRGLHFIADPHQNLSDYPDRRKGWFSIDTYSGAGAVRCSKDPRVEEIGFYETTYLASKVKEYTKGLENPNSYLQVKSKEEKEIIIPVNKAYAVYNQYLTDHEWPVGNLSVNVYWTTNKQLIKAVKLNGANENADIRVKVNANESGNAVVSLHSGANANSEDPVLWSWHIWVPNNSPVEKTYTHTTEKRFADTKPSVHKDFLMFSTKSGLVPLTTEFMDRNLGALEYNVASSDPAIYGETGGFHYQWGRKDPIPTFQKVGQVLLINEHVHEWDHMIFLGSNKGGSITYKSIHAGDYVGNFTKHPDYKETPTVMSAVRKASENPLLFTAGFEKSGLDNWLPKPAPELWGHADVKSPFDPCPEGWRVPDGGVSAANSPWSKELDIPYILKEKTVIKDGEEVKVEYWDSERMIKPSDYKVQIIPYDDNKGGVRGRIFNDPEYNLGQIPGTGIRGIFGGKYQGDVVTPRKSQALWTASMANTESQYAMGLYFEKSDTTDEMNVARTMRPYWGVSVRCAKDQPRFTEESIANTSVNSSVRRNYVEVQSIEAQTSTLTESQIKITPNPTSGLFKVMLTGVTEGKLSVVNINGTVIHSQTFANSTEVDVNIQNQPSGVYVVQVQAQGQVVNKKVIKK